MSQREGSAREILFERERSNNFLFLFKHDEVESRRNAAVRVVF